MDLKSLMKKELIQVNVSCHDQEELFKLMCTSIIEKGYAKESFYEGIKNREASFPTGIELNQFGIAIPHTDPEHTVKPFVSVVTLKKAVKFKKMENINEETAIKVIFMMGLEKPESSIQVLTQLAAIFQNEITMNKLVEAASVEEFEEILHEI